MARLRRASLIVGMLLATALAAGPAPDARADADPPSDVLITQDVYYPYAPRVSLPVGQRLFVQVANLRKKGYPLKVALIATTDDLGAVGDLFGQPVRYAHFLAKEISFNRKEHVLAVMPAGFGQANTTPEAERAVASLKPPGTDADAIARAAMEAVARIGDATGHHVGTPPASAGNVPGNATPPSSTVPAGHPGARGGQSSGSGGGLEIIAFIAPVVLVALGFGIVALRHRREEEAP